MSIDRTYAIAATEVTRKQWRTFLLDQTWTDSQHEPNVASADDPNPMNLVNWYQAAAYCNWLSHREGIPEDQWYYQPNENGEYKSGMRPAPGFLTRTGYRLPTEAEWEFACRAGTVTTYSFGEDKTMLPEYSSYVGNSSGHTHSVARFKPNELGLFDMHGNVWEWCQDLGRFHPHVLGDPVFCDPLRGDAVTDSHSRILRGGGFEVDWSRLDSADRGWHRPALRTMAWGFRIARTIDPGPQRLPDHPWYRAHELGRKGSWSEAAGLMQQALAEFPEDDAQRWRDVTNVWHFLGKMDKVRANGDEMLRRFGSTEDPQVAHLIVVANLKDADREFNDTLERLIDVSVSSDDVHHLHGVGLCHLRCREFSKAIQWLQPTPTLSEYGQLYSLYYLATAQQHLGDHAAAQASLDEADRVRAAIRAGFADGDFGPQWYEWIGAEAVRREAEHVLGMD